MVRLSTLMRNIEYRVAPNSRDPYNPFIDTVTADHREAGQNTLFVCAVNAMQDGHFHAELAYERGCRVFLAHKYLTLPSDARVMLVEDTALYLGELAARVLGYPARRLTVLGVTGSAGKTSVVHTLTALLNKSGRRAASLSSDGVFLGGKWYPHADILPDAVGIQRILRDFADAGVEIAVLELSAYMLHHKSAFSIPFTAVLLTNLFPTHIKEGVHRSFSHYERAKASLFELGAPFSVLPANFVGFEGISMEGSRVLRVGDAGDFSASECQPLRLKKGFGTCFTLTFENGEKHRVSLPVAGDIAVKNALSVAALARIVGLLPSEIAKLLSRVTPRGRLECVASFEERYIYVDSAYDAASLRRALAALRPYTEGKLTVLIGSVGGRARERRAPLGRAAVECADFAYFTADDPNFEDVRKICEDMAAEVEERDRFCIVPDRRDAIKRAILEMRPGDVLLIAGKGGERHQLVSGVREPLYERKLVREYLALI